MNLFQKYDVAGPRYTSYPTVPAWKNQDFHKADWLIDFKNTLHERNEIGIYIHLPYCESLCTFCACHKHITVNHSVEETYIAALLRDWKQYIELFDQKPILTELHLGGGTPSFFSPQNLQILIRTILAEVIVPENHNYGFEGHPLNTTKEHLAILRNLGFNRVSFGVQDYDLSVQKAINRVQGFEEVARVTKWARELSYESISHDLVYGLPFQTVAGIKNTVEKTLSLRPNRLSFYSYAHVPWIKGNGQRGFSDEDIPVGMEKRALYDTGKAIFEAANYAEIGMDHFALADDEMFKARKEGRLHRNFMGYTTDLSKLLIPLGASAIGRTAKTYFQIDKNLKSYLQADEIPILKGHLLSEDDQERRAAIEQIMCYFKLDLTQIHLNQEMLLKIEEFKSDGILEIQDQHLKITKMGLPFVRNVAMIFDQYLQATPATNTFSKTV